MKPTRFRERFSKRTGILSLMDDLGRAMDGRSDLLMLGGGNPAHLPQINALWRTRIGEILANGAELERTLTNYDTPQGKHAFIESLADLLNREFGWNLNGRNVAITNGSQTGFFLLLNLFSGTGVDGSMQRVLFPLCPEYIGYADQAVEPGALATRRASIELTRDHAFKYHVDFGNLELSDDIAALCVSRPTNPTGNVLTDAEVTELAAIAGARDIPLMIDNAYGAPFPNILFTEVTPFWDRHVILTMSLSKLGLPSVRTGIIVADEAVIEAVSACNAVISLANGSIGQVLVQPLITSGEIIELSNRIIKPFYRRRSAEAMATLQRAFAGAFPFRIHECEGALFLWLWLPSLPVSSAVLYERLKQRGVLVVSGHYFFYGLDQRWPHADQCLRLSYALDPERFARAAAIMADEIERVHDEG